MRKYLAELIATFTLVFCGTGAIVINQETNGVVTNLGIAITFGLVVTAMIYTFGKISGAHMNPAVTIAFWLAKKTQSRHACWYIVFQIIGASLASLVLAFLFDTNDYLGSTQPSGSAHQSFILEFFLTYFLMLTIASFSDNETTALPLAGAVIGAVVLLEALFAGPICGASMNPARSIGPALISGHLENLWIYLAAPILGAIAGNFTWRYFSIQN